MDAFAVSVAGGIKSRQSKWRDAVKIGLYFGGFQAAMPLIGWVMGNSLRGFVMNFSGWIAFILLTIIGLKMIKEALVDDDEDDKEQKSLLNSRTLLLMAIATSIDALVVGITLSLIGLPLLVSVAIIGIVTFVLSVLGFQFGKKLGAFFAGKIEIVGGIALIAIGVKLLLAP
ncbi:MAG: rane protein yebN [Candidatus Saccharibacteria bacterium]|nr:rane protein yebN [Candidatus Saccharibacteria bacterium]